jgi:hypothetical protein
MARIVGDVDTGPGAAHFVLPALEQANARHAFLTVGAGVAAAATMEWIGLNGGADVVTANRSGKTATRSVDAGLIESARMAALPAVVAIGQQIDAIAGAVGLVARTRRTDPRLAALAVRAYMVTVAAVVVVVKRIHAHVVAIEHPVGAAGASSLETAKWAVVLAGATMKLAGHQVDTLMIATAGQPLGARRADTHYAIFIVWTDCAAGAAVVVVPQGVDTAVATRGQSAIADALTAQAVLF